MTMTRKPLLVVAILLAGAVLAGGAPLASTLQTLVFGTYDNWYTPASYASNLAVFQEIEKKTNVHITWDVVPPGEYWNAMRTRLAAGKQGVPDMISVPGRILEYGQEGMILPLEDLIDTYAPNIKKYFSDHPEIYALKVAPNGHMYTLTTVTSGGTYANPFAMNLRMDWLQKLGLKEPATIDDWYTVMKAFKSRDPNGNGQADEIPLIPASTWTDLLRWGEAWGLKFAVSDGYSVDKNGKVTYDWESPRFKELLTWLNKLYTEGLIDQDLMSYSTDIHLAKVTRNLVGVAMNFISNTNTYQANLKKAGIANARYKGMPPVKGPYGDQFTEGFGPVSGDYGITANCKDPVLAIKWYDYVYASQEGNTYILYGIEGKSYKKDAKGNLVYTDYVLNNPSGMGPYDALRALGAWPNIPYIQTTEACMALAAPFPDLLDTAAKFKPFIRQGFPFMMFTSDESATDDLVSPDMDTYRKETVSKFIIGQIPLTQFDAYVAKVKSLGSDKMTAVRQNQWDRYQAALKTLKK
jgi:putative aldouronate transport system substrate-binding protein